MIMELSEKSGTCRISFRRSMWRTTEKITEGAWLVKTFIRATTTAASAALATLLTIGAPSMSAAATFVCHCFCPEACPRARALRQK